MPWLVWYLRVSHLWTFRERRVFTGVLTHQASVHNSLQFSADFTFNVHTRPRRGGNPQYNQGAVVPLHTPSADTRALIHATRWGLCKIYRTGYAYKKASVLLSGLEPVTRRQVRIPRKPSSHNDLKSSTCSRRPPTDNNACRHAHPNGLGSVFFYRIWGSPWRAKPGADFPVQHNSFGCTILLQR